MGSRWEKLAGGRVVDGNKSHLLPTPARKVGQSPKLGSEID